MQNKAVVENIEYPTGIVRAVIVGTCVVASLLAIIDSTVVNVSLRHIAGSLGASTTDVAWVITAFAISNVIIIPLSGMLAELFGTKVYFTASILIFTISSFMCGNSTELWELILWRFIQGLGGGALMTQSQTILAASYPPKQLGLASVIYGIGIAAGPALGPTLGGFITDNYSWHWVFYINVPLGLLAATTSWLSIPNEKNHELKGNIDWWGILFLSVGIGSLQYVLEEGNSKNWFDSHIILLFSVIAGIGLLAFIYRELTAEMPAVNIRLLGQYRNLALGVLFSFIIGAILYIAVYAFPLMAQINLGWTATMSGLALMPGALMSTVGLVFSQKAIGKGVDPKIMITSGFICTFIFGMWMSFQSENSSFAGLFIPLLFRGLGIGLFMLPVIMMSIQGLSGPDLGQGAGLSNMAKQLGGAVGLAMIGTHITNAQALYQSQLSADITPYSNSTMETVQGMSHLLQSSGMNANSAQTVCNGLLNVEVLKNSELLSYLSSFRMLAVISVLSLFFMFFLKKRKKSKKSCR
ncbi:MAG: DHA2 family efflux MFS transporter permease subunit [Prevotella sp.]|jgi:DHA2 family multidrug resistance protein|nr:MULTISPECIES: DHA2 family efflux MFS transporter permease subunit [unclassified Prevotella]MCI1371742.1 DHA2 family efflux MFS transporter permease subunit [Prevotella sp.]MCI1684829.1 DHA2 family efflux MFS transporter permease subunit [Prevotella sp.]MCI1803106.1 DHA2 family efflux MFS transporter permease subunit [Prevotella sp.]MCI1816364.1 DHA2 family efflux MFS transporter permease subunit [Prevotella sp.]MCI1847206.1 DHA2 family efflux MFS transporter permease subunit [Prevotella sp.